MNEPRDDDPTRRFTGLSEAYAQGRPDYPAAYVDFIVSHCHLNADTLLVDVGCGAGISSRLFAARGVPVIGVEPNEAMLAKARAAGGPANLGYRQNENRRRPAPAVRQFGRRKNSPSTSGSSGGPREPSRWPQS